MFSKRLIGRGNCARKREGKGGEYFRGELLRKKLQTEERPRRPELGERYRSQREQRKRD